MGTHRDEIPTLLLLVDITVTSRAPSSPLPDCASHLPCMAIHCVLVNGRSNPAVFSFPTVLDAPL